MLRDGFNKSLWQETTMEPAVAQIDKVTSNNFDVIIAGAGITGLTTGLQLLKAGKSVLILEAHTAGFGTTGGTTAHLNTFLDTPYKVIKDKFSKTDADIVAKSVRESISLIENNAREYAPDCGFVKTSAFVFSQDDKQTNELQVILEGSLDCGVSCNEIDTIPISQEFEKAIEFPNQACFHPTRYLIGLIKAFRNAGGVLVENSRVTKMDNTEPINVTAESGEYKCEHFIYATHIPPGVNLLHFRCAPYRSYAISCKLENENEYPDSLVYDLYDPYHYYRTQLIDGEKYLIAGGEDHKTGHEENTENCFRKLEAHVRSIFKVESITQKWSSQYYEPADGLPYIGHLPGVAGKVYVATGYGGNGITYSGVSALLLTDIISGGTSEWADVYDPNRIKMVAGFSNFMKEAADVVGHLFKKAVIPTEKLSLLADIAPGQAAIVKYDNHKIAIYKTEAGQVYALHTACTHIKCDVAWNATERTWDCPCHGSRFNFNGEVLTAPARKPLESVDITNS